MQEIGVPSLGWEDPLDKGMAIHSCILGWKVPWTEKPGGLQSVGSQSPTPLRTEQVRIATWFPPCSLHLSIVSRGSAGEYQADEQAGVARLRWRGSGR